MTIRVLLADDHIMIRDALAEMLAAQPDVALVGVASDGRDAVEQAVLLTPDVAVLDVSMPHKNGIEAAAEIRKLVPGCRVVALSALGESCFVRQMAEAGASAYVQKSESGDKLVGVVRLVHAGHTCLPGDPDPQPRPGRALLSRREREVLSRIGTGRRCSQIALDLGITVKTVDTYRRRMMGKLGLHSQTELMRYALALGGEGEPQEALEPVD
jgi:DNA-binding NarL/FixJ family response regulator